ncbi:MAG: helix-turn-helix domain-containing protein [Solirubrobacteraceae bacterium]
MIHHPEPGRPQDLLAANLRRLRIARHLSLSELSRATGISKATLSGIESAHSNPTVDTLGALARSLRVSIAELLEQPPPGEVRIVRAVRTRTPGRDAVALRPLDELAPGGRLVISELSLPARHAHEVQPASGGARVHVYVLEGKLIAGPLERISELVPGDYAAFPGDVLHVYEAGGQRARALLLLQMPS